MKIFNKKSHFLFPLVIICVVLFCADISFGADVVATDTSAQGLIVCGNPGQSQCSLCHIIYMANYLMKWAFRLMFIFGVVMIFISGVMYIVAGADPGLATKAKGYIKNTLLGVAVIVCAWLIVNTVIWVMGANTNLGSMTGTWYNPNISCPFIQP